MQKWGMLKHFLKRKYYEEKAAYEELLERYEEQQ